MVYLSEENGAQNTTMPRRTQKKGTKKNVRTPPAGGRAAGTLSVPREQRVKEGPGQSGSPAETHPRRGRRAAGAPGRKEGPRGRREAHAKRVSSQPGTKLGLPKNQGWAIVEFGGRAPSLGESRSSGVALPEKNSGTRARFGPESCPKRRRPEGSGERAPVPGNDFFMVAEGLDGPQAARAVADRTRARNAAPRAGMGAAYIVCFAAPVRGDGDQAWLLRQETSEGYDYEVRRTPRGVSPPPSKEPGWPRLLAGAA